MSLGFGAIWVLGMVLPLAGGQQAPGVVQVQPAPDSASQAMELVRRARLKEDCGAWEEALALSEEVIQRFEPNPDLETRFQVLTALKTRGCLLAQSRRTAEAQRSDQVFALHYGKELADFFQRAALLEMEQAGRPADAFVARAMASDAKVCAEAGRYPVALLELEELIQRFPAEDAQLDALEQKSQILGKLKLWPQAIATCDQLLRRLKESRQADPQCWSRTQFRKADGLNQRGQPDQAIRVYDDILEGWPALDPDPRAPAICQALQLKGANLLELHREQEGIQALEASFQLRGLAEGLGAPEKIAALTALAVAAEQAPGSDEDEFLILDGILLRFGGASDPLIRSGLLDTWRLKAEWLNSRQRSGEAGACEEALLKLLGAEPETYFQDWISRELLKASPQEHGPKGASPQEHGPKGASRLQGLAQYFQAGPCQAEAARPSQARLAALLEAGLIQRCRQEADAAFRPVLAGLLGEKAKRLLDTGQEAEALPLLAEAISAGKPGRTPEEQNRVLEAMYYRARLLWRADRQGEALAGYDAGLAYWRGLGRSRRNLFIFKILQYKGTSLVWQDKYKQAIPVLDAAMRCYGSSYVVLADKMELLTYKGTALIQTGQRRAAAALYNGMIRRMEREQDPDCRPFLAVAMAGKGDLLEGRGHKQEALALFAEVLRRFEPLGLDNQLPIALALEHQAILLAELDRPQEALANLDRFIARAKDHPQELQPRTQGVLKLRKAILLLPGERLEEACALIEEVAALPGPEAEPELRAALARTRLAAGYQRILRAKQVRLKQGPCAEASRELEASLALSHRAEVDSEDRAILLGNISYALFLSGRAQEAEAPLREALQLGGEPLRKGEREDAGKFPLAEDPAFLALLERLWAQRASGLPARHHEHAGQGHQHPQ